MGESIFRILLAEDEPVIRELVRTMLEADGVEVICVPDGKSALGSARSSRPDVVLLDVVLPGLDGFSVCRLLRGVPSFATVPIYMLAARSRKADHESARRAGATGYVEKPFKAQDLQALIAELRTGRVPPSRP